MYIMLMLNTPALGTRGPCTWHPTTALCKWGSWLLRSTANSLHTSIYQSKTHNP